MSKILVTGANGQLGRKIRDFSINFPVYEFIFSDINQLDICSYNDIDNLFSRNNIDIVINCAAYTAVDNAEEEYEQAYNTNCIAVENLAKASLKYGFKVIHISTDYVFDGSSNIPYNEKQPTNPLGNYGKTKLEGEKVLLKTNPDSIIIRTSWLYSEYGNNFFKTMIRLGKEKDELKVVFDQIGTPTYAGNLAEIILTIIMEYYENYNWKSGIYHFSNQGVCSWYDFAYEILILSQINTFLNPVLSHEFPTKAVRPKYSVLDKTKITSAFNYAIPHWTSGLRVCFEQYAKL